MCKPNLNSKERNKMTEANVVINQSKSKLNYKGDRILADDNDFLNGDLVKCPINDSMSRDQKVAALKKFDIDALGTFPTEKFVNEVCLPLVDFFADEPAIDEELEEMSDSDVIFQIVLNPYIGIDRIYKTEMSEKQLAWIDKKAKEINSEIGIKEMISAIKVFETIEEVAMMAEKEFFNKNYFMQKNAAPHDPAKADLIKQIELMF